MIDCPVMEHSGWYYIDGRDTSPSFVVITVDQVGAVAARITVWDAVVKTISLEFDRESQVIEFRMEIADKVPSCTESTLCIADDHAAAIAEAGGPEGFDGPRLFDLLITRNESLGRVRSSESTLVSQPTR